MRSYYCILCSFIFGYAISQNNLVTIKGTVTNDGNHEPVENATINLNLSRGYTLFQKTDSTGNYEFKFKMDSSSSCTISISINKDTRSANVSNGCYLNSKEIGVISELGTDREYIKDFSVTRVMDCGGTFISPILFNANSIVSCNDSLNKIDTTRYDRFDKVMDDLYKILKANPTIVIELTGHASSIEKDAEHIALYRAQLLKEIMIAKGINRKRIETKSYGNRKVLIRDNIIKKAKSKEEKTALHLKNQRVVFRVLNWDFKE